MTCVPEMKKATMLEKTAPRIGRMGREYPRGHCRDCGNLILVDAERCEGCVRGFTELAHTPDSCQIRDGAMGDVYSIEELEARVRKMRALGVTRWGTIELGPEPQSDAADDDTTQRTSPADHLKQARSERQRVASLASGGPVPAVGRSQ